MERTRQSQVGKRTIYNEDLLYLSKSWINKEYILYPRMHGKNTTKRRGEMMSYNVHPMRDESIGNRADVEAINGRFGGASSSPLSRLHPVYASSQRTTCALRSGRRECVLQRWWFIQTIPCLTALLCPLMIWWLLLRFGFTKSNISLFLGFLCRSS